MDRQRVREREAQCTQEWPPACTASCPVHVDARAMIERVQQGDWAGGLAVFGMTIPFPRIISRICDRPCERACKRVDAGDAVRINALERACVDLAETYPLRPKSLAKKGKRVAVVGAGLSGLTAAVDLAVKGYAVVLFEAQARAGGRVRDVSEAILPQTAIASDLKILEDLAIEVRCSTRVGNAPGAATSFDAVVQEFDAVYLGTGPASVRDLQLGLSLTDGERLQVDPFTFATSHEKVFAGGGLRCGGAELSPMSSLQDGRYAAVSIDRFLQKASLTASRDRQGPFATRLFTSTRGVEPLPATAAADPAQGYSAEEAVQEAGRCLRCQCLECVKACEYLAHYGSYPKRYVRQIYNNDCIVMGTRTLNRMVNSCALCGLCETVCPEKLNMGEVSREARQSMVGKGRMPPSIHEFALRDMVFSKGEHFSLARHEPGHSASSTLFFPGCQLAASSPDHVALLYDHLRSRIPGGVGLHLGCCGAPADWAARSDLLDGTLEEIAATWKRMGSPRVVTACSSCQRIFRERLPDARVDSVWPLLAEIGLPTSPSPPRTPSLAVHDPCAARSDPDVQDGVRAILAKLGIEIVELGHRRETTTCCGYGGLMSFANPEVAGKVVERRIAESGADYVAYCAMCRDNFASKGKRSLHLLDLLFRGADSDPAARSRPTFSERHENRARLRARLLRELWGEESAGEGQRMNLIIPPEVMALLEKRMILVEDVAKVITHAEAAGEQLEDAITGHLVACHRPVTVTYWVEYSLQPDGVVVHNAYSHRMEVR